MMLDALYKQLSTEFKPQARKDIGTAVRVLANVLGCPDPQHCPPAQYQQPLPIIYQLVTDHLRSKNKSADVIRNTKNHLSRLFRKAKEKNLSTLPSALDSLPSVTLTPRFLLKDKPLRPGTPKSPHGTYLTYAQWSPDLKDDYAAFESWALTGRSPERKPGRLKRQSTTNSYRHSFQGYFGYLAHVKQLVPTFRHLYDRALITEYVNWHVDILHQRPTHAIHVFLKNLLAMTNQYQSLPELHAQLLDLKKTVGRPTQVYNKEDAMVPIVMLRAIAQSHYPKIKPTDIPRNGAKVLGLDHAVDAGIALMLRLWTDIPYRQRNMREMKLGTNLHKDDQGKWWIKFKGTELKIGRKRDRENISLMPVPENVVPLLEDYLVTWRPILLKNASPSEHHVFLTRFGSAYKGPSLTSTTSNAVWSYTHKHWHPHIIRTTWATEWIKETGDLYTAAIMLGDTLAVVMKNYAYLLEEDVAEKAYRVMEERMRLSPPHSRVSSPLYT